MKRTLVLILFAAQLAFSQASAPAKTENSETPQDVSKLPFRDPSLSIEQRVDDLVSRLTVE